jgi:hypothetical protein
MPPGPGAGSLRHGLSDPADQLQMWLNYKVVDLQVLIFWWLIFWWSIFDSNVGQPQGFFKHLF